MTNNAKLRENLFRDWLKNEDGKKENSINNYVSNLRSLEKKYNEIKHESFSFFTCEPADTQKIKNIIDMCKSKNGELAEFAAKCGGGPVSASKKYLEFLTKKFLSNPKFILHKNVKNIDPMPYVSKELLQTLFLKNIENLYPDYAISKKAQRGGAIILEKVETKNVLVVLLEDKIATVETFGKISALLPSLTELFSKDGFTVNGLVIAGKLDKAFVEACKTNPSISGREYNIELSLKTL